MGIGIRELVVILIIVIILFGAKRIPDLARGIGQGLRLFKKEMKGDGEEKKDQG